MRRDSGEDERYAGAYSDEEHYYAHYRQFKEEM